MLYACSIPREVNKCFRGKWGIKGTSLRSMIIISRLSKTSILVVSFMGMCKIQSTNLIPFLFMSTSSISILQDVNPPTPPCKHIQSIFLLLMCPKHLILANCILFSIGATPAFTRITLFLIQSILYYHTSDKSSSSTLP